MWPHNREETSHTYNTSHCSSCRYQPYLCTHVPYCHIFYRRAVGEQCGGRLGRGDRRGHGGLTLVSLSSSSVSSLFWAARPSWSSLTIRMMWFQLNSLIRSNQTWAWWEYGGTVRRKDKWMLCIEDQRLKRETRVHINDLWLLEVTLSGNNLYKYFSFGYQSHRDTAMS